MGNVSTLPDSDQVRDDSYDELENDDLGSYNLIQGYILQAKAERFVASEIQLHASQMEALGIVWTYFKFKQKKNGGAISSIVNWSGRRYAWKRKIKGKIEECIVAGVIERVPYNRGFTLKITPKGFAAIELFETRALAIRETIQAA